MSMITNDTLIVTLTINQLKRIVIDAFKDVIEGKDKGEIREALLSPEEARKVWQPAISKVTLHRWTKAGLIPVHRIGGRIYYKHSELISAVKGIHLHEHNKFKPEVILSLDQLPELLEKYKDKL